MPLKYHETIPLNMEISQLEQVTSWLSVFFRGFLKKKKVFFRNN
jgi:hypothetical protein